MKKTLKVLSLTLVITMLFGLVLAGCGSDKSGSNKSDSESSASTSQGGEQQSTSSETSAKKEPVEIVYVCWGDAIAKKATEEAMKIFESQEEGIKVKPLVLPNTDYDTKVTTMVAANEQIDLAELESATIAYPLAEQGKLLNLRPLLENDEEVNLNTYIPEALYMLDKDTIIGIGYGIEMFNMFYNPEMFESAGVPTPPASAEDAWDWDTFVEVAKKLTIDANGKNASEAGFDPNNIKQYGVTFPKWWGLWGNFVYANGGDYITEDGEFGLSKPEAVEAIQKLADLINVHHVAPNATSEKGMPGMDIALQTKKVAMVLEGQWCHNGLGASEVKFEVAPLPKMKYLKTQCTTGMLSVFSNSVDPKAAFELLKFLNDPEKNLGQYVDGTLMPVMREWLTEQELVEKWAVGNQAHSSNYQKAVIGSLLNHGVPTPTGTVKNFNKILDVVNPELDKVWTGEVSAEEALKNCEPKVADLIQGKRER